MLPTSHCIPVLVATLGAVVAAAASPQSARVRVRAPMVADRLAHIAVSSLTSSFLVCCVVGVARMNISSRLVGV